MRRGHWSVAERDQGCTGEQGWVEETARGWRSRWMRRIEGGWRGPGERAMHEHNISAWLQYVGAQETNINLKSAQPMLIIPIVSVSTRLPPAIGYILFRNFEIAFELRVSCLFYAHLAFMFSKQLFAKAIWREFSVVLWKLLFMECRIFGWNVRIDGVLV